MSIFAVNVSQGNLVLKQGFLSIPQGSYKELIEGDDKHPDVLNAVQRSWLVLTDDPKKVEVPVIKTADITSPDQGLTAEQLKALREKEAAPAAAEASAEVKEEAPVKKGRGKATEAAEPAAE